jgi:hypothetical protein
VEEEYKILEVDHPVNSAFGKVLENEVQDLDLSLADWM